MCEIEIWGQVARQAKGLWTRLDGSRGGGGVGVLRVFLRARDAALRKLPPNRILAQAGARKLRAWSDAFVSSAPPGMSAGPDVRRRHHVPFFGVAPHMGVGDADFELLDTLL